MPRTPFPDVPAAGTQDDAGAGREGSGFGLASLWWFVWLLMLVIAMWMGASYR